MCCFFFKRIEKSEKDMNFYTGLKNAKAFLWIIKRIEKHVTIIHRKSSLPDEDKACITSLRYRVQIQCEGSKDFTNMEKFCSCYCQMLEEFHCMARPGNS